MQQQKINTLKKKIRAKAQGHRTLELFGYFTS
jgi:hypothetical protein